MVQVFPLGQPLGADELEPSETQNALPSLLGSPLGADELKLRTGEGQPEGADEYRQEHVTKGRSLASNLLLCGSTRGNMAKNRETSLFFLWYFYLKPVPSETRCKIRQIWED